MVRVCRLFVALALLCVAVPSRVQATFHFMSISEVGVGFLSEPNIQFVELRLDAAAQNNLTNTRLTAFDKDGLPTELLLTPNGVANGTTGRNVLYATTDFQTATGIAPDFIIPPGVITPKGMICWGAPGTSPPDPTTSPWDIDKPNNYVDCVAYGSYGFATRFGSGTPTSLSPGDGTRSLTRAKNSSVSGSNDTDFVLAVAHPCNNANQCAFLAPTPTVTPTPIATPTPGKAQITCRRAVIKAANKLGAAQVQARAGCETSRLKGKVIGPCPDVKAAGKILLASAKLAKAVTKACGALPLADTGFGATCPGYTGGCSDLIVAVADVSPCVDCAAQRAGNELAAAVYAAPPDEAALKCQLGFGKAVTGYYRAVATLLARCEDGIARGKVAGPCPDPKTAAKIAAKSLKLRSTLCKACGGKDKLCDGIADVAPATLGIASCPARSVPGGTDCGVIGVTDLAGIVECVACLADFASTCTTAVAAHPQTLPASCNPPP